MDGWGVRTEIVDGRDGTGWRWTMDDGMRWVGLGWISGMRWDLLGPFVQIFRWGGSGGVEGKVSGSVSGKVGGFVFRCVWDGGGWDGMGL